jgi:hypothetical protein
VLGILTVIIKNGATMPTNYNKLNNCVAQAAAANGMKALKVEAARDLVAAREKELTASVQIVEAAPVVRSVPFKRVHPANTPVGLYRTSVPDNWVSSPNYKIVWRDEGYEIRQATPKLTWQAPTSLEHGAPLGDGQLRASADLPGTYIYSPAEGTILNAGTHTLTVEFTPTDTHNYTTANATVTVTVNAALCRGSNLDEL